MSVYKKDAELGISDQLGTEHNDHGADGNRDPISGEAGAHPVGVAVGTVLGGATAGAAAGAVAGPAGMVAGAVVGGVAGGLAGKSFAEELNPSELSAYWEREYPQSVYFDPEVNYSDFDAAYLYGYQARSRFARAPWEDIEAELAISWDAYRTDRSKLPWSAAWKAIKDGYERDYSASCGSQCE